jgi:hypothetical protein
MNSVKLIMNFKKAKAVYATSVPAINRVYIPSGESQSRFFGRSQQFALKIYSKGVGIRRQQPDIKNSRLSLLAAVLLFSTIIHAQKTDTLAPLRDFIQISNGYKQIPMYLSLEMRNSTNFVTTEQDTATLQGEFFLRNENSYVQFGEFEQIVNDSIAVMVSNLLKQIILYTNAAPVIKQMKTMMGMAVPDSSLLIMSGKYSADKRELSKKSAVIELQSRTVLYGTSLPKETIELQYSLPGKMPELVTTMRRSLLRLDSLQYDQLQKEPALLEKLLALEGSYFLIKEQVTAYVYKKIQQGYKEKVPVQTNDRVMKNEKGEYIPVKKYEAYRLTVND